MEEILEWIFCYAANDVNYPKYNAVETKQTLFIYLDTQNDINNAQTP